MILEIGRRVTLSDFHVVGSAAILAVLPNPPEGDLTATRDVDVIPPQDDERMADRISFVLGEASDFDREYGYYAQGVTSTTPKYAPSGWKARAVPIRDLSRLSMKGVSWRSRTASWIRVSVTTGSCLTWRLRASSTCCATSVDRSGSRRWFVLHATLPEDLLPYRHLFQAPLEFNAGETSVVFARDWLRHTLPAADPILHSMMQEQLNEIERAEAGSVADRIRRLLPTVLAARSSSIPVVAQRLGLTVRTLSRVLVQEGTTYRLLRDEARYAMACELLRSHLSVAEVSDRLGYTNPTAFTFAFRRWARMPPSKWREQAETRAERRTPGGAGWRRQRDK